MRKLNKKGFSLVELLAAIAILAILMTVATQAYNAYKKQARQQAYDTMAKSATTAATNYLMENTKAKYITFETLKEKQYVDTLQDPRYKDKECTGIVINKVIQGQTQKQLDVLFQKVKLCCKNYKYQYDYTGDEVKVTEIDSCEYVEGDEIDGVYKLIYKTQGGTDCDPGVVMKRQREKWGPLCETTRDKFVFKGWNTKKKGTGAYITADTVVGDKDVNAYAIWNAIYTLTYDEDGGTPCNPKSFDKENGEKWGELCETSKENHAFKGWKTKKNGEGSKITKTTTVSKSLTAYAHWNPYYTLTFDSNGGSTCNPNTITEEKGEEWGPLCTPTRSGYAFKGWNTKKDGTGDKITKTSTVEKTMTVYAIWNPKYTLTFDSNGGDECDPKNIVEEKGKEWGKLCETKKTGYSFDGWYNGTEEVTSTSKVENTITVTAKWKPKRYTINYNNNGGDGCTTKNADYGTPWGKLCEPTREGYSFVKWTNDTGTVTKDTICYGSIDVLANWSINSYTLTYNDNGGANCAGKSITKEYNKAWGTLCTPTRTGYDFKGWYLDSTQVTNTSLAKATIEVKAKWTANKYTLTYDDNTGSGCSDESVKAAYGGSWGTLCTPKKTGHSFVEWNTEKNGTGTKVDKDSAVTPYNLEVYAQWSADPCTLTYNNNGGSGCSGEVSKTYGNKWGTLCSSSTKSHYDFAGWNTKSDGSGTKVDANTSTTTVCDSTIYAQWTKKNYKLSYSGTGANQCREITKAYNTAWGTLCTPTRTGYTFIGWYNGSTQVTDSSLATADIVVTPMWSPNSYTLTYNNNSGSGCTSQRGYYDNPWGELCTPSRPGYNFAGWYNSSGTQIDESTVCYGALSVTAAWVEASTPETIYGEGNSTTNSVTITLTPSRPDTSKALSYSASSGTASCSYSGSNIVCTVTGITKKTVTNSSDCKELANALGVSTEGVVYIGISDKYNSADYYKPDRSAGIGCYRKAGMGPGFSASANWSCYRADTTFFTGSSDHCPKSYCGSSSCLTYGYSETDAGLQCNCYLRIGQNIKTYYDTTVTVTYYKKG